MFGVAVRRQTLVALAAVVAVVIENAVAGSPDWGAVGLVAVLLALLCLSPVAFASTRRSYRIAATVVALLLTISAVFGTIAGDPDLVPAAVVAWLCTIPTRRADAA